MPFRYLYVVAVAVLGVLAACASHPSSHVCATGIVCPSDLQCAAVQPVCIVNDCGNGKLDVGEECDDGNVTDADGCSPLCKFERCGNLVRDPGELCDDGNTADGDGCSSDCMSLEQCGNGVKDMGEACDDGNAVDGDGCAGNCKSTEVCGNCIVDVEVGEVCDTCGVPSANCSNDCRSVLACGNGFVDPGEECDHAVAGNTNDRDCRADCVVNRCGDGFVDSVGPDHAEDCDPAAQATTGSRVATPLETSACNIDCTARTCGDRKVNRSAGEECDDGTGNNADDHDCTALCHVNYCGDGLPDTAGLHLEACDTGGDSQTCNADCTMPSCGDGKVNRQFTPSGAPGVEQCDDGGTADGDGCDHNCQLEHCGNGVIDTGEECDGAAVGGFTCSSSCRLEKCGNGVLDPGEQCDDGNASDTDDCLSSDANPAMCKRATCGDLHVNSNREQCDHGSTNGQSGDSCDATCHDVVCGNGIVQPGEQCDDGSGKNGVGKACNGSCQHNVCGDTDKLTGLEQCDVGVTDTSGCNAATCTLSSCGDGHKNSAASEACDHGSLNGTLGDTCDLNCQLVGCGNAIIEPQNSEQCDPGTGSPATDTSSCDFDCSPALCGDGYTNMQASEMCDQGSANGTPCSYGTKTCTRCASDCSGTVTMNGPYCGDALTNGSETCDDGAGINGTTTCAYGTATCTICNSACTAKPTRFGNVCGDRNKDATFENCDNGNTLGCGLCSSDCRTSLSAATAATGTIVTPDGSTVNNGQTFVLVDGYGHTVTFEFSTASSTGTTLANGHIAIAMAATKTAAQEATEIKNAINGEHAANTLDISVTDVNSNVLTLGNDHSSSLGNQAISNTGAPNNAGWATLGMSGGSGGACVSGTTCTLNGDCKSGSCNGATHQCT